MKFEWDPDKNESKKHSKKERRFSSAVLMATC